MLWVKSFHIIFVIAWFAGLFYLPRLFVYHADTQDTPGHERFCVMERRLFGLMTIAAVLALGFGLWLMWGWYLPPPGWLHAKLTLVVALVGYHLWCYRLLTDFRRGTNRRPARWYRLFNELPSLLLVAIVLLAVLKPF
ncbi:MAG TPA: CopD family protein [Gammaproteobacteria bacterium]|nr:CopD family protein [Gammaproteobacteria bacterium]